jgi:hypothetical protein
MFDLSKLSQVVADVRKLVSDVRGGNYTDAARDVADAINNTADAVDEWMTGIHVFGTSSTEPQAAPPEAAVFGALLGSQAAILKALIK